MLFKLQLSHHVISSLEINLELDYICALFIQSILILHMHIERHLRKPMCQSKYSLKQIFCLTSDKLAGGTGPFRMALCFSCLSMITQTLVSDQGIAAIEYL